MKDRKDLDEKQIWDIYTMLTDIEDAFRCMKSELGLRPNYHQIERRIVSAFTYLFLTRNRLVTREGWTTDEELEKRVRELERAESERKRAEEKLRESEERYRAITETLTDYIFTRTIENGDVVTTVHGPGCVAVTGCSGGFRPL